MERLQLNIQINMLFLIFRLSTSGTLLQKIIEIANVWTYKGKYQTFVYGVTA